MNQQKELTRDRILGAAETIFADKGYHDALVDEIASVTSLSKGGVYFHFPSKEDLFFAVLDKLASRLMIRVETSSTGIESPLDRAGTALEAVLVAMGRKRRVARLLLLQGYSMGNAFEAKRVEIFGCFGEIIRTHLDDAVSAGEIKSIDTQIAATAWLGAMNEVVIRWLFEGGRSPKEALPTLHVLLIDSLRIEGPSIAQPTADLNRG